MFYKNGAPIANAEMYIDNLFSKDKIEIKNAEYDYIHDNRGEDNYSKTPSGAGGIDLSNYSGAEDEFTGEQGQNTRQTVVNTKPFILDKGNREGLQLYFKK